MTKAMMVLLVIVTAVAAGGLVYVMKPSAVVHSSVTIEAMRKIAQLATTEYTMSAFADQEYESNVVVTKVVSDYVIVSCKGKVRGSVDMEKATIDVQDSPDNRQVSIHFGRGSVLVSGVEVDPNDPASFRVISCRDKLKLGGVLKSASAAQRDRLHRVALQEIEKACLKAGIVEKTMANAKTSLGDFVGALGYRANITFDEKAYDPSAPQK